MKYLLIVFFLMGCDPECQQIQCDKKEEEKVQSFMKECLIGENSSWECCRKTQYIANCKEKLIVCRNAADTNLIFVDAEKN